MRNFARSKKLQMNKLKKYAQDKIKGKKQGDESI